MTHFAVFETSIFPLFSVISFSLCPFGCEGLSVRRGHRVKELVASECVILPLLMYCCQGGSGSLLQRQLLKVITQAETNKAHSRPPFDNMCTVTRPGLTANRRWLTQIPNLPSKGKPFQSQWVLNERFYIVYRFFILQLLIGPNISRPACCDLLLYLADITRSVFLLSIACWRCYFEEDAPKLPASYSLESRNWKALADVTGHGCDFSACDCYSVIKHGTNVRRESDGIRKIMRPLLPRSSCSCQWSESRNCGWMLSCFPNCVFCVLYSAFSITISAC